MLFSRRQILGFFGSFSFSSLFFGRCKTTNKIAQSSNAVENADIKQAAEIANNLLTNGFKIVSLEGEKGISQFNNAGKVITKCMQIMSPDGKITITDLSWNAYKIPGQIKRWKFDEIEWSSNPLIDFTFSKAYSGKDVSVEVAFFDPSNPFYPTRIFQQLIRLG
jgi:hypothetical protein